MAEQLSSDTDEIRAALRERYASAATGRASCCSPKATTTDRDGAEVFGQALYDTAADGELPVEALRASLGCGVPTAVAELRAGEIVLDLGSGAGADVPISARRVGPTGLAIGLDMTDEMLALARNNAAKAGLENVEFREGYIEEMPVADASVDVVISNCVINLSADTARVINESARVQRPVGRFAVSDVIADAGMDEATREDMQQWTGCIAGALTHAEFTSLLNRAGFEDVEIHETNRVHEHAAAAIVRARKPGGCCTPGELERCCEPAAKAECCGAEPLPRSGPSSCGCR